jgi:hypothetical protein
MTKRTKRILIVVGSVFLVLVISCLGFSIWAFSPITQPDTSERLITKNCIDIGRNINSDSIKQSNWKMDLDDLPVQFPSFFISNTSIDQSKSISCTPYPYEGDTARIGFRIKDASLQITIAPGEYSKDLYSTNKTNYKDSNRNLDENYTDVTALNIPLEQKDSYVVVDPDAYSLKLVKYKQLRSQNGEGFYIELSQNFADDTQTREELKRIFKKNSDKFDCFETNFTELCGIKDGQIENLHKTYSEELSNYSIISKEQIDFMSQVLDETQVTR